jgi:hypothetical protein
MKKGEGYSILKEEQEEMGGAKLKQRRLHLKEAAGRYKWTNQTGGKGGGG